MMEWSGLSEMPRPTCGNIEGKAFGERHIDRFRRTRPLCWSTPPTRPKLLECPPPQMRLESPWMTLSRSLKFVERLHRLGELVIRERNVLQLRNVVPALGVLLARDRGRLRLLRVEAVPFHHKTRNRFGS